MKRYIAAIQYDTPHSAPYVVHDESADGDWVRWEDVDAKLRELTDLINVQAQKLVAPADRRVSDAETELAGLKEKNRELARALARVEGNQLTLEQRRVLDAADDWCAHHGGLSGATTVEDELDSAVWALRAAEAKEKE